MITNWLLLFYGIIMKLLMFLCVFDAFQLTVVLYVCSVFLVFTP